MPALRPLQNEMSTQSREMEHKINDERRDIFEVAHEAIDGTNKNMHHEVYE